MPSLLEMGAVFLGWICWT